MSVYNELCIDISKEREKRAKLLRQLYAIVVIMVVTVLILCIAAVEMHKVEKLAFAVILIALAITGAIVALSVMLIKIYFTLEHEHILLERLSIVRQTKIGNTPPNFDKNVSGKKQ